MKLIANHSNVIEQRAVPGNRFGLEQDIKVAYQKNIPFEIPDAIGQEYLKSFPFKFRLATDKLFGEEPKAVEEIKEVAKPVDAVEAVEDDPEVQPITLVDPTKPPTLDELLGWAESDPERVFTIAESLEIKFPKNILATTLAEKINAKIIALSSK